VHRLQRLVLTGAFGMLLAYALGSVGFFGGVTRHDAPTGWVFFDLVAYLALVVAMGINTKAVRPSLARVREVAVKPRNQRRARLIMLPVFIGIAVVFGFAFAFAPGHGLSRALFFIVLYAAMFVIMQVILAPLLVIALRAKPLPAPTAARLRRLADDMGVKVHDVRGFEGRDQKVANAVQVGLLPRLRYVLVSDYLIDNVSDDELDAVVAHEFGHIRGRHVALKLLAVLACWIGFGALYLALRPDGTISAVLTFVPLIIAMPVGLMLVNGLLGVRLEQRADDAAAAQVGAPALTAALRRLAELNHTKRDTSRAWAVVTQPPGLDDRVARLRKRSTAGAPAVVG
jgi:STE24 endopeptidase